MDIRKGYKAKTIKAILQKKFNNFVNSIEDPKVKQLVRDNTIITGGCIASMLLGEKVNDFDLYFENKETTLAVANYYVQRFKVRNTSGIACNIYVEDKDERVSIVIKSSGIASAEGTETPYEYFESSGNSAQQYVGELMSDVGDIEDTYEETQELAAEVEDDTYRPVFMSTNAITLSNRIQLVLRFYGKPDEIHENYDFVHCTNYWRSKTGELVLHSKALESLLARELRYVGSKYPVCSVIRLRKFIKRGWTINAGQILKMMLQINDLNLRDIEVLRDQLTGVDSAYFCEILGKVQEKDPDKLDTAYLVEVIDRMF